MINTKTNKYLTLFTPSAIGAVMYTFSAGLVIILNQFEDIKQYLQLPRDFEFVRIFTAWLDNLLASTLGQGRTEAFVVGLFWAVVGLGVYILLRGIARRITELGESLDERRYVWPMGTDRNRPAVEVARKILFCAVAFIGLLAVLFGPLARAVGRPVTVEVFGSSQPFQYLVWFASIWILLHISVILTRLMVLRPRLFN